MTKHSKKMILIGALLLVAGLMFMLEPYYTWAQENSNQHPCRVALQPNEPLFDLGNINPGDTYEESVTVIKTGEAPAQLYFAWEWLEGEPGLGEDYNLFDQLQMTIRSEGREIFKGSMGDWQYDRDNPSINDTINLTEALGIGSIIQGDEITLDIEVYLPGPETGNEYQGAWTKARLVFFTICDSATEDPEDPGVDPEDPDDPDDTTLDPEDPKTDIDDPEKKDPEKDPKDDDTITIDPESPRTDPPLPRTDGTSIGLAIVGILFIMAGMLLRKEQKA